MSFRQDLRHLSMAAVLLISCSDDGAVAGAGGSGSTSPSGGEGPDGGGGGAVSEGGGAEPGIGGAGGTASAAVGGSGGTASDSAADDFERARLSGDWVVIFPLPPNDQVRIIDDSDLGMGPGPQGFFLVNWRATTFAPDQFCEGTIPLDVNVNWLHQVYVRWRVADGARYGFHYNGDPGQPGFGNWAFKYDGVPSAQTRVIAETPATLITPPGPGDTLRIEVEGFELRGYKNGSLVLSATDTDASQIGEGEPGLAARWATGNQATTADAKVWEAWAGGSL
jgi:hypothetical protein